MLVAEVTGRKAGRLFRLEPGGHRWQRVPPTEKRGRRHTSTVTVAVLPLEEKISVAIRERDLEWQMIRGSGNGGQKINKTSSCVRLRHVPTGIAVRVETERSQYQNRETALRWLSAKLADDETARQQNDRASWRRQQIGSGQRGDKVRTVQLQHGTVIDHRTGKRVKAGRYLKGHVAELF